MDPAKSSDENTTPQNELPSDQQPEVQTNQSTTFPSETDKDPHPAESASQDMYAPPSTYDQYQSPSTYTTEDTPQDQAQPEGQTVSSPDTVLSAPPPKSSKKKFLLMGLLFFVFLLLIGSAGLVYAVAYEKIKLEKYPDIQKKVSHLVMSIPFMPKTPKFLLAKSALAHQEVKKQSFDVSLAIDSDDLASSLGLSSIDMQAKGAVDYSDPKDVKITVDASITKDFNFEIRKKDPILYFKINKIPAFLFAFLGFKSETFDPLLDKWVSYDTTPLNTEARQSLQDREVDPLSEEYLEENFNKYIDEEVLQKMKLESVKEDGIDMYKISTDADANLIDHIGDKLEAERSKEQGSSLYRSQSEPQKLSEMIKKLTWEIYIDKKDYYTRKIIIRADVEVDGDEGYINPFLMGTSPTTDEKSKVAFAFAFKSGNFGEDVNVEVPESAMSFEEFTDLISEIVRQAYSEFLTPDYSTLSASARDAQRKSDLDTLRAGLELYNVDCGKYPQALTTLQSTGSEGCETSGTYLYSIPNDPAGSSYYYKTDGSTYDLCATLESETGSSSCPNPLYNYHVKNP